MLKWRAFLVCSLFGISGLLNAVVAPAFAHAAPVTFTVNSSGDFSDAIPGDGLCEDATSTECTLRAAIDEANATEGTDPVTINFQGGGMTVVVNGTALPSIDRTAVTIDGTANSNTTCGDLWGVNGSHVDPDWKVHLDLTNSIHENIKITGGNSVIKGLDIVGTGTNLNGGIQLLSAGGNTIQCNNLHGHHPGILIRSSAPNNLIGGPLAGNGNVVGNNGGGSMIASSDGNTIQGNFFGTDASGMIAAPNGGSVLIEGGDGNTIGGTTPGSRNLISSNIGLNENGVNVSGNNNTVQGNYIGTDPTGNTSGVGLGNLIGMIVMGSNNTVGGTTPEARNIVGTSVYGMVFLNATENTFQGNYIGVGADGTSALPISKYAMVLLGDTSDNLIGGTDTGAGNGIAHSDFAGISTYNLFGVGLPTVGNGNSFLGNNIYDTGNLGIHLTSLVQPDSDVFLPLTNDANDSDTGPNDFQNYPVLTEASATIHATQVSGTLNSLANTSYRLEFFANATTSLEVREGQSYLGSTTVTTDSEGNASFTATNLAASTVGDVITATASQVLTGGDVGYFNTSEFSSGVSVVAGLETPPPSTHHRSRSSYSPPVPPPTSSGNLTSTQISSIIALLMSFNADTSVVASVQATLNGQVIPSIFRFTHDLHLGSFSSDVQELQKYLNTHGFPVAATGPGSPGHEVLFFGLKTQAALIKYQITHQITPALGYFGPKTRVVVNRGE